MIKYSNGKSEMFKTEKAVEYNNGKIIQNSQKINDKDKNTNPFSQASLIFSILTYFGIIRYINMYIFSSSSYANSYKTLERAKNDKVVINIMINPDKHSISSAVINSLLDQTVKVDEINIFSDNPITLPSSLGIYAT